MLLITLVFLVKCTFPVRYRIMPSDNALPLMFGANIYQVGTSSSTHRKGIVIYDQIIPVMRSPYDIISLDPFDHSFFLKQIKRYTACLISRFPQMTKR